MQSNTSLCFTLLKNMNCQTPKIVEVLDLDSWKNLTNGMRQHKHMSNTNLNLTRGSLKHGLKLVNQKLCTEEKFTQFTIYLVILVAYLEC